MKPPNSCRLRGILLVYCLYLMQGKAAAQDSGGGGIDGATIGIAVGVSIATSFITTLLTLTCAYMVMKSSRKKRESPIQRDAKERASTVSSRYSDASMKPLFKRSESQETSMSQQVNGDLRYRSGTKQAIANNHNRFKSDYTAKWCTENALTEATAQCLREKGFTTRAALEALRVEDIHKLDLRTIAEECKLRETINRKLKKSESQSSMPRNKSTSEECLPSPNVTSNDTSAGSSFFERSSSMHQMDSVDGQLPMCKPLRVKKRSMGSMEVIDDDERAPVFYNNGSRGGLPYAQMVPPGKNGTTNFNGLLSDNGLWQLANMIGAEWPHLATLLRIPKSKQDQIQLDYPSNTMVQINEMLRLWRDSAKGSKAEIKGRLHEAFMKVKRNDLAEYLLQETIHGSEERVHGYHAIV